MEMIYRQDQTAYHKASWFCSIRLKNENGEPLRLSEGEKLVFGVKADHTDTGYIVKKVLTADDEIDGGYPIVLTPYEMTLTPGHNPISPDRYWYDVSVQSPDGSFIKIVPQSAFIIKPSFTEKELS